MLQTFTIDGNGRQIDAKARFFRYESGNAGGADESIRVRTDGQDLGTYLPGDAIKLPVDATRWVITPTSSALIATVRLGTAAVESARLVGTVRVVDEGASKTLAGLQFFAYNRKLATAGVYSIAGILAGARTVVVKRMSVSSSAVGIVQFWSGTGALTSGPNSGTVFNKRVRTGAAALAVTHSGFSAAAVPTGVELPGAASQGFFYVPAALAFLEYPLTTPLVIAPGEFFGVQGPAVNTEVGILVDMEEKT